MEGSDLKLDRSIDASKREVNHTALYLALLPVPGNARLQPCLEAIAHAHVRAHAQIDVPKRGIYLVHLMFHGDLCDPT